jgi:hypothetical protein
LKAGTNISHLTALGIFVEAYGGLWKLIGQCRMKNEEKKRDETGWSGLARDNAKAKG